MVFVPFQTVSVSCCFLYSTYALCLRLRLYDRRVRWAPDRLVICTYCVFSSAVCRVLLVAGPGLWTVLVSG